VFEHNVLVVEVIYVSPDIEDTYIHT